MKTPKQRADERREEKLRDVERQIEEGTLVVRRMTKKELAASNAARKRRDRAH